MAQGLQQMTSEGPSTQQPMVPTLPCPAVEMSPIQVVKKPDLPANAVWPLHSLLPCPAVEMSPIKIVKNPDGSMQRAAMTQASRCLLDGMR